MKEKAVRLEDEQVSAYRRYVMKDIFSSPQESWEPRARMHLLTVRDHIIESFATGPWLDRMLELKEDLARMGNVKKEDMI